MEGLQITFKSGAQVTIDADEFASTSNAFVGRITELNWNTPADWTRKLHWLDLSEVACLVMVRNGVPFPGAAAPAVNASLTAGPQS